MIDNQQLKTLQENRLRISLPRLPEVSLNSIIFLSLANLAYQLAPSKQTSSHFFGISPQTIIECFIPTAMCQIVQFLAHLKMIHGVIRFIFTGTLMRHPQNKIVSIDIFIIVAIFFCQLVVLKLYLRPIQSADTRVFIQKKC